MNLLYQITNLLFPRFSSYSNTIYSYVDKLGVSVSQEHLKKPLSKHLEMVYVAYPYEGKMSDLLDRVKLGGEYDIALELSDIFAQRVWDQSNYFIPSPDIVIPVPPDPKRLRQRGFHVASILARSLVQTISKDNGNTALVELLMKIKHTKAQSSLDKQDRKHNVKDNFVIDQNMLQKSPYFEYIWLIDDIVATQSTLNECAKVLHEYFPEAKIYGISFCGN